MMGRSRAAWAISMSEGMMEVSMSRSSIGYTLHMRVDVGRSAAQQADQRDASVLRELHCECRWTGHGRQQRNVRDRCFLNELVARAARHHEESRARVGARARQCADHLVQRIVTT